MSQSKSNSLLESLNAAAFAAPTAMLLHKAVLMLAGDNALNDNQDLFVVLSWFMFFWHSVAWKYALRRVYDHYGYKLEPKYVFKRIKRILL